MAKKRIDTRDLVKKIEKITKARIAGQEVVPLDSFREIKQKVDPKSLLVIEDDETMRAALKRIFEAEGYLVKLAADGTELSKVLDDLSPDLILLDVGLPWINGFELAQLLKDHSELRKIPLIFVSGQTSDDDVIRAKALGADEYVKKPFDIEKLRNTVAALLKRQSS